MSTLWCGERRLIVCALVWVAVFVCWPALHAGGPAFAATVILIGVNIAASFRALTQRREVLVALNCVQISLFGILNYQLHCVFGAGHYRFDREPGFHDWVEFTAAHVLRAADLLDAIDDFGIPIQTISHDSVTAGVLIVCMHVTVDVFLIGLALRWASRYWPDLSYETHLARGRREAGWVLATLGLFGAFAVLQRLEPIDWLLWPIENLLRLLDVGDMFQVFGWRLHGVEKNLWTSAAAFLFRVVAGLWMARVVNWTRLTVGRSWGLSIDELTALLDDPDAQVRRGAAIGLSQSGSLAAPATQALITALHDVNHDVRLAAIEALGRIGPAARDAVAELVDAVWLGQADVRLAALAALACIGPAARTAVYSLFALRKVADKKTRRAVEIALESIAPDVLNVLPRHKAKEKKRRRFGRRMRRESAAQVSRRH